MRAVAAMGVVASSPEHGMTTELIHRVAEGPTRERAEAFAKLMEATRTSVWRMHWALWAQLPRHARVHRQEYADELTQETYLKAFEKIAHGGSRPDNFRVWVHRVGQRLALDRIKAAKRLKRTSTDMVSIDDINVSVTAPDDPCQHLVARQVYDRLMELLNEIGNVNMRDAFILDLNTELTRAEIADLLDITEDTVTSYCARVRKILHEGIAQ